MLCRWRAATTMRSLNDETCGKSKHSYVKVPLSMLQPQPGGSASLGWRLADSQGFVSLVKRRRHPAWLGFWKYWKLLFKIPYYKPVLETANLWICFEDKFVSFGLSNRRSYLGKNIMLSILTSVPTVTEPPNDPQGDTDGSDMTDLGLR